MNNSDDLYKSYWDAINEEYLKDAKPYVAQINYCGGNETIDMG